MTRAVPPVAASARPPLVLASTVASPAIVTVEPAFAKKEFVDRAGLPTRGGELVVATDSPRVVQVADVA